MTVMLRYRRTRIAALTAAVAAALVIGAAVRAQEPSTGLQAQLRERYDLVALQRGVALVPHDPGSSIRMIQIADGVISIDGEMVTGRQLRDRLGADADPVLQASYLTIEQQRALAAGDAGSVSPPVSSPAPTAPSPAPPVVERTEVRGDRIRFGGDVVVERTERIEGDVVAFGGSVTVDGEVDGTVTALGGPVILGPDAIVRGDLNAIGGPLTQAPGAQVRGEINEVGRGPGMRMERGWFFRDLFGTFWSRMGSLAATVLRLTVLLLVALVVVAFGRPTVERIAARTAASPLRSGLIGLAAEILFIPVLVLTVVVLAVSIVGIPLLALVPFAVLLLLLVAIVGFAGLASHVGSLAGDRLGRSGLTAYGAVALGVVVIGAVTVLGKIAALAGGFVIGAPLAGLGYLVEFVAWTVGFGSAILYWYERQAGARARRAGPETPMAPAPPTDA